MDPLSKESEEDDNVPARRTQIIVRTSDPNSASGCHHREIFASMREAGANEKENYAT